MRRNRLAVLHLTATFPAEPDIDFALCSVWKSNQFSEGLSLIALLLPRYRAELPEARV
jgi:hypothetical protein